MAKRTAKATPSVKTHKAGRWTVRGIEPALQRAAGDAARARGLTLGHWLNELLREATVAGMPGATVDRTVEARLDRLEDAVFGCGNPPPARQMGGRAAERPAVV